MDPKVLLKYSEEERQNLLQQVRKKRAKNNLLEFIKFTKPNYVVNWHHKLVCEDLDDFLVNPDRRFLIITFGPRRGKTEVVSRRLPAYYFGKFPNNKIISCSYGDELSSELNREVQQIMDSPEYGVVFPNTKLPRSGMKSSEKKNKIRTSKQFDLVNFEGGMVSAGVDGPITGKGFHLGIIDDPIKNSDEAQSATRLRKIWNWYDTTFSTRGMPNHKIIIMMTRWSEGDLVGRLLEQAQSTPDAPNWEVLCFPEIYDENHPWVHPKDPRKNGEVLWPQAFSEREVLAKKATSSVKNWNSLYQQLPTPDEGVVFHREDFNYYTLSSLPEIEYTMLSVDCAFKKTEQSDYVAMGMWGVSGPNKYLLHMVKERLDFPATIEKILSVLHLYPNVRKVLVEDKANGPAVIATLKKKISRVVGYTPKESKEARANAVSPQVAGGNVYLPDPLDRDTRLKMPWCVKGVDEFLTEVCAFPYAPNDDLVDMMTQALLDIGEQNSWVQDWLGQKDKPISKEDKLANDLAELMGWDLSGDSRYGGLI